MAEKYVGFDVHAATTSYCVQDSKGKVVAEGVVETGAAELVSLVKRFVGKIPLTLALVNNVVSAGIIPPRILSQTWR